MADSMLKNPDKADGVTLWRVELYNVYPFPKEFFGKFYDQDSYILLKTEFGPNGKPVAYHAHFWIGKKSSFDDASTSVSRCLEMEDMFTNKVVMHREIQGHESDLFLSYFKAGMSYLEGNISSAINLAKKEQMRHQKAFHQVKGRRVARVWEVPSTYKSMNEGDVFVLNCEDTIYIWCGQQSNPTERAHGMILAKKLSDERLRAKPKTVLIETGSDPLQVQAFFKALGDEGPIQPAEEGGDDVKYVRERQIKMSLHRLSDASGKLIMEKVSDGPLKQSMLDPDDCFILDQSGTHIFAWIGRGSTQQERFDAMKKAVGFLRANNYPDWTPVTRVTQGSESLPFKHCFTDWVDSDAVTQALYDIQATRIAKAVTGEKFDPKVLHSRRVQREAKMFDDASGTIEMYVTKHFELFPIDPSEFGQFYSRECYIIKYCTTEKFKDKAVLYYWQGKDSSTEDRGATAMFVVKLDDMMHGKAIQIPVNQGKESEHFMAIFKRRIIIFKGSKSRNEPRKSAAVKESAPPKRLFRIRESDDGQIKAIECECLASSLNSNDAFILISPNMAYIWAGKGCSGDEREASKTMIDIIQKEIKDNYVLIMEGEEPDDFWILIGGKAPYSSGRLFEAVVPTYPARLLHCSNVTGAFRVQEIFNFNQDDLIQDDVMILDTYSEVYVWIGRFSLPEERRDSLQMVQDYIQSDPSGRKVEDVMMYCVKQGFEPPAFTGHFLGWVNQDSASLYDNLKREIAEKEGVTNVTQELKKYSMDQKYPLSVLLKTTDLPEGVDITKKEMYLTDEDFLEVFKITKAEYNSLPGWKRLNKKKAAGLF